jgi:Icc-related predicted phosphoesterase
VAFSDLHGQYSKKLTRWFNEHPADILLFAGDLQLNGYDDGSFFLQWLNSLPYKHRVMIFGNHDGNYDYTMEEAKKYTSIHILNNESIIVDGIKIWGSPYSVQFGEWWFMKPDNELYDIYKNIPDDTDIVMTHTPAFGVLDKTIDGINAGSIQLRFRIDELNNLKYHVAAHIHEGYGMEKGTATFINCSILDEKYRLVNDPVMFEI